jgi:Trypsin-co-occurring domain 2
MPEEFALADAIEAVRRELRRAQDEGRGGDVRFVVGPAEVEFTVEVVKAAGGEASVKVLNLVSFGGLTPVGVGGAPFEVASVHSRRPDRTGEQEMGWRSANVGRSPSRPGESS